MNKKTLPAIAVVVILVLVCGLFINREIKERRAVNEPAAAQKVMFPLPAKYEILVQNPEDIVITADLSVKETEKFYRAEFVKWGLTERTINTLVTGNTFSMIFDGYKNGKALVVQGTDFNGKTNVSIRFEDL